MKTLAIRLDDDVHARLTILAKLAGVSLTDAIRSGVDKQIAAMSSDPALSAKAEALRNAIEREAREQHEALADLFGSAATPVAGRTRSTTKPATS